jgi:two-component system chemotaxis response regulator CheB
MAVDRIVVMGASAGGVAALEAAIAALPAGFRAPVLIVLHIGPAQKSLLPEILSRIGLNPAVAATHGDTLAPGRIYVAVADHHLAVDGERIVVTRGPKENRARPSVDVLFRSAAYHFGSRVIGVVMSGSLADGSSGLYAIKRLGGVAVIQAPDDAVYSSMPLNALRRVDIDYALPAADIGLLLTALVDQPAGAEPLDAEHYRQELKADIEISAADSPFEKGLMEQAEPSPYTCPECHGVLFRIKEGQTDRFRCHTGHGYSTGALVEHAAELVEATLWQALKTLQETSALLAESAARLRESGDEPGAHALAHKAEAISQRLEGLRALALERGGLNADANKPEH